MLFPCFLKCKPSPRQQQTQALFSLLIGVTAFFGCTSPESKQVDLWPDGTEIPEWFSDTTKVKLADLGTPYVITDFGAVGDSTVLQTEAIQQAIDEASSKGGGVIIIPKGVFLSGALFFKPNTHLHVSEGAVLKEQREKNGFVSDLQDGAPLKQ